MTDPFRPAGDGHTMLSDEDRLGLIPTYIATRADLFEAEQGNILRATLRRPPTLSKLLDDRYIRNLHGAMFGEVWDWAGRYRLSETNIGIEPKQISTAVRTLVDDAKAWAGYGTYEPDELAVRFHHRLVAIHPFPNGNGRLARIVADYLISSFGGRPFSWGARLTVDTETLRAAYRKALQNADNGDITELIAIARA